MLPDRADGAGRVGAVAVVVHRVVVVGDEIPAADVVDVAVVVVIDAGLAVQLDGVDPDVVLQVIVVVVDARVDDADDGGGRSLLPGPRLERVDVGVNRSAGLAQVVHAPKICETRVVRGIQDVVRLCELDDALEGTAVQIAQRLFGREPTGEPPLADATLAEVLHLPGTEMAAALCGTPLAGVLLELDQDLAGNVIQRGIDLEWGLSGHTDRYTHRPANQQRKGSHQHVDLP